jgi:adenine/guanine phosphoribosyltransferase-like PRPP-binding protein
MVAAVEARGFIIGAALAFQLGGCKRLEENGQKVFALCEFEGD